MLRGWLVPKPRASPLLRQWSRWLRSWFRRPGPVPSRRRAPAGRFRSRPVAPRSRPTGVARREAGSPICRTVPPERTAIRSAIRSASSARCDTCTTVVARSLRASSRSSKNARRASASRPAAGSSSSNNPGSTARARARLTRCASPPESVGALRFANSATPSRSSAAWAARMRGRPVEPTPAQRQLDVPDHAGREQARSLCRVADAAPKVQIGARDRRAVHLHASNARRLSSPAMSRSKVVLPAPFGPSTASRSPARRSSRPIASTSRPPRRWRTSRRLTTAPMRRRAAGPT